MKLNICYVSAYADKLICNGISVTGADYVSS